MSAYHPGGVVRADLNPLEELENLCRSEGNRLQWVARYEENDTHRMTGRVTTTEGVKHQFTWVASGLEVERSRGYQLPHYIEMIAYVLLRNLRGFDSILAVVDRYRPVPLR